MLFTIHYGTHAAIQSGPYLVLMLSGILSLWGVKLYLDYQNENLFLETRRRYSHHALKIALRVIDRLQLEPLSEDECMPEATPNGGVRIYLAERARA